MNRRVAVVGASGLVGTALVSRLLNATKGEVVSLIHSSGNAWRLASQGVPLRQVDLLDKATLVEVLGDCTHIVNCSRGEDDFMIRGLRNLLEVARVGTPKRFIHLSSVAVYGDPPSASSESESAPTNPAKGSYGSVKLQQDVMVARAAKEGLSAITLCPPNIGGPYSYFFNNLVVLLRARQFALIDDGDACCSTVDVANLAFAIELALDRGPSDGSRIFVTDPGNATWRNVIEGLAPLADVAWTDIPKVSREELSQSWPPPAERLSPVRTMKHLLSSDVRRALRKDPLLRKIDQTLRDTVARFGSATESRLRKSVYGSLRPSLQPKIRTNLNYPVCAQQLRGVRHSSARAFQSIGYLPRVTLEGSLSAFSGWYRWHQGFDSPYADLTRELF